MTPGASQGGRVAEAAALLDHLNIVPILEVSEENGCHFFAAKLIEGGALSERIAELLKDPKLAARLLAKVARAVQHAHERGILHRDLKPANILIGAVRVARRGFRPCQAPATRTRRRPARYLVLRHTWPPSRPAPRRA